jgi:hypothetical protein
VRLNYALYHTFKLRHDLRFDDVRNGHALSFFQVELVTQVMNGKLSHAPVQIAGATDRTWIMNQQTTYGKV